MVLRAGWSCSGNALAQPAPYQAGLRTTGARETAWLVGDSICKCSHLLEGLIIFILVTLRSMISSGRSNSSTMHSGMAPPQGCAAQR